MDDPTLRSRYRQLMERRQATGGSSIPLETLEALAEGRLDDDERIAALEAVYSDPAARAEFEFLREIARERPRTADRRVVWLAVATLIVVVGGGLLWRASSPAGPDPLRGPDAVVTLLVPAAGASLAVGDSLAWRPTPGALRYTVEIVTDAGEVAFRAETTDTVVVLAAPAGKMVQGPGQWWVTANLGGTAAVRSAPRRITVAQ
jgi:hypothetical protein